MSADPARARAARTRAALVATAALLVACRSVPPDEGFAETAALVREHGGLELAWRRFDPADAALDERVRALVADELSIDDAVRVALLANRRLQALYAELGFAQAEVLAAVRLPNPILHGEVRFPADGGRSAIDLGLEQSFLSLLWMPRRERMAQDALEAAQQRLAARALGLAMHVRASYRRLQGALQARELLRTSLEAAEAAHDLAQALLEAGNVLDLDAALARAQREEARVALADAELAVLERREALVLLLGLYGPAAELRVNARLPELPAVAGTTDGLEARAVESSLTLGALRSEIRRAGRALDLADARALVPDLEAGIVAERESEGHQELGPSFALPLPLFSQGQPARRRAAARLEELRETYLAEAVELRSRARRAAARVVALHARAGFLRDVLLPLRARVLDGIQLQLNAMQTGAFRLLDAKREQLATAVLHVDSLTAYWVAASELDGLLEGAPPPDADASMLPAPMSGPTEATLAHH